MSNNSKRKEGYHSNDLPRTLSKSQDLRRQEALTRQKTQRQNAFDQARSSSNLNMLSDLNLMDSDSDSSQTTTTTSTSTSTTPASPSNFNSNSTKPSPSKKKKTFNNNNKPKFFPWAKDLLMYAESLDLELGLLPPKLESDWSVVVAPKGKRVVVVSGFTSGANTVLLARATGRSLERRVTSLPPDCILDCLYDRDIGVIWVLDLIKWRGTYYIDFDFTFRSWFLSAKLSELPLQPYSTPTASFNSSNRKKPPLLVLPTPRHPSPLTPSVLLSLMSTISIPTTIPISILSNTNMKTSIIINLPFSTTGYLLFLNNALYNSGPTTLACWIPNEVAQGREELEGLGRMNRLVEEWNERGGKAREGLMDEDEDEEVEEEVVGESEVEEEMGEGEMDLSDD